MLPGVSLLITYRRKKAGSDRSAFQTYTQSLYKVEREVATATGVTVSAGGTVTKNIASAESVRRNVSLSRKRGQC